jgi:iron complex transport system substrate-binding protein
MFHRKLGPLVGLLAAALCADGFAASAQEAPRTVVDSGGRRVEIPARISRVLAAGPPASILLFNAGT